MIEFALPSINRLNVLWAKSSPRHSLWTHLFDSAAVSLALPNPLARWSWTAEQVALIVGLHDVGKADAVFQHQVEELSAELAKMGFGKTSDARCRHERISARFVRATLRDAGVIERDAEEFKKWRRLITLATGEHNCCITI